MRQKIPKDKSRRKYKRVTDGKSESFTHSGMS